LLGEAAGRRRDLRQRIILDGDHSEVDGADRVRMVGRRDLGREGFLRCADFETPVPDRVEVSAAGEQDDLMAGPSESTAEISADSAGS
jgi:hypothetical protein